MPYAGQTVTVLAQFQKVGVDTAPSPAPTVNIYPPGGPATTGQSATAIDATNFPGWYSYAVSSVVAGSYAIRFLTSDATTDKQNLGAAFVVDGPANFAAMAIDSSGRAQVQYGTSTGQISATSGIVDANAKQILGTVVSTPATAGILDVNTKNINNVATTSVTTINANQGMTQPLNFTGTGASALAKADMVDVAGAAVSTASAQLGVTAVNLGGAVQTEIDAIKAKTDLIGGASVTLVSNNLTPGATMHLRRTDSYKVVDGRAFSWTLTGQPSITSGAVLVTLTFGSLSVPLTGSVLSGTQPQVEIIASQMTTLPPPTAIGKYVVLCTPTDNDPFSFEGSVQIDA